MQSSQETNTGMNNKFLSDEYDSVMIILAFVLVFSKALPGIPLGSTLRKILLILLFL